MKLKLVVASMSVLGLISCNAFAATTTKHKTHHRMRHHHMVASQPCCPTACAAPAPCVEMPRLDCRQVIYDTMGQNLGRFTHGCPDWFNRVAVSGGIHFDGVWGNRRMGYMGENDRRLSLNDVYLNTTAMVNDCTKAFISLSYNNASNTNGYKLGRYSSAYPVDTLYVEQAYMTFNNFGSCDFPVFIQLGKQFTDFGRYTIHPMTRTLAQVLTESLATSAKIGFIMPMGLNGQLYAFENPLRRDNTNFTDESNHPAIYGASLGWTQPCCDQLGYDIGIGWMSNMFGVNDVAYAVRQYHVFAGAPVGFNTFSHNVPAWSVHADVNSGPFMFGLRYVRAASSFSTNDLSNTFNTLPIVGFNTAGSAKPWAYDLNAGYNFATTTCCGCQPQSIYVSYQRSGDAVNLLIPRQRWMAGYSLDPARNTTLALELSQDRDYATGKGGTGKTTGRVNARVDVRFG